MRPLESLLVLVGTLAPLLLWRRNVRGARALTLLALLLLALHLRYEGAHWQMAPIYLATLAFLPLAFRPPQRPRLLTLSVLPLLALGALLMWALPVAQLPKPGGPYPVGTLSYHLVDAAREEAYTETEGDARELMVQLWYPADPADEATPVPWLADAERFLPALAKALNLPPFLLSHLALIQTHSYAAEPLADIEQRYPVIVYIHGWQGFRTIASHQMETLASHGYIVVALDHTYGSLLTLFEDGRVAPLNPDALPSGVPQAVKDRTSAKLVETYAEDVRFLLDWLARLDQGESDPRFAGRLDLARLGLYGHSTGGGAVVRLCATEPRCVAGAGLDAWVEPVPEAIIQEGLRQPFLFLRSETWTGTANDARLRALYDASTGERYLLSIRGTAHRDFTLQPLLSPLTSYAGLAGSLDAHRTFQITDEYLLAFFDHTLRAQRAPLLDVSPYAEVQFDTSSSR